MRRGRAPADNTDVLAMFRLQYSGERATQPLVDDISLTKEQKWQLLFDRNWRNLAPSSQTRWLVYLRKWKKWIDDHPEQPEGYLVFPSTCHAGIPDDEAKFPSQPYIAGVTSRAKTATAEARQCEEADPSCSASILSNEEYASLLEAAMRCPDKQVGLCMAAMVSCGLAAGFRSDDLQDTGYFMELIRSVPAEPLPMQILALASNVGKANQDAQMTYAAFANHRQPHLDCLAYLSQLVLYQINVMHLMRCSGTVSLAAAACSMDVVQVWGRWARSEGTVAVPVKWIHSLVPHARVILQAVCLRNRMRTGKADFSGQHCVESILYLAETFWQSSPFMLQSHGLGWWALQLPAVRFIVGSSSFRQCEQRVIDAELECNARPLSPQMTQAFDKISKQVCSLSEQLTQLQLSMDGMMHPVHSQTAANNSMPTVRSSSKCGPPEVLALSLRRKWACPQA
ncbi:TPA: hypothetical protein ACH3X1_000951 [Trebouxia sp. C0004]